MLPKGLPCAWLLLRGGDSCLWPFILSPNLSVVAAFGLMGDGVVSGSVLWYPLIALMRVRGSEYGVGHAPLARDS